MRRIITILLILTMSAPAAAQERLTEQNLSVFRGEWPAVLRTCVVKERPTNIEVVLTCDGGFTGVGWVRVELLNGTILETRAVAPETPSAPKAGPTDDQREAARLHIEHARIVLGIGPAFTVDELLRFGDWAAVLVQCRLVERKASIVEVRCEDGERFTVNAADGTILKVQSKRGYIRQLVFTAISIIGGAGAAVMAGAAKR